jgi:PPK2 family polyphosphate:nucleotide phosphotransferase
MTPRRRRGRTRTALLAPVSPTDPPPLTDRDATYRGELPDEGVKKATKVLLETVAELQGALQAEARRSLLVVLQARDAGGKDGTIKKVFGCLNPVALRVASFKVPSADELAHDFLWRVHREVPRRGTIGVFNRSHYEDVLVPRVEGLVPRSEWEKRYEQINEFERMLTENGTTILKLFLHVSRDEQERRLQARMDEPEKQWKAAKGDWLAREKWAEYGRAYRDMLLRCSTSWAPWYVVPGDDKKVRNWVVANLVLAVLSADLPGSRADSQ